MLEVMLRYRREDCEEVMIRRFTDADLSTDQVRSSVDEFARGVVAAFYRATDKRPSENSREP